VDVVAVEVTVVVGVSPVVASPVELAAVVVPGLGSVVGEPVGPKLVAPSLPLAQASRGRRSRAAGERRR